MLQSARRTLFGLAARYLSRASLLEGRLAGPETPFRLLVVGSSLLLEDLKKRTFAEPPAVVREGRTTAGSLKRLLAGNSDPFDVAVAVVHRGREPLFRGSYRYRTVEEIRQVIPTTAPWEEVRKAFVKKKRQITNDFEAKYGLSYRVSREPADFDLFYDRMHVPLIRRRYGPTAEIDPREVMRRSFEEGHLLFVVKEGRDVAGALSSLRDGMLTFHRSGVLDADESHVKAGAQTALYYFQLRHCVASGYQGLDVMNSTPFLDDGVYRHKAEWGAVALPDATTDWCVLVSGAAAGASAARFFERSPLVVRNGDGLMGVIGDPQCEGTPAVTFEALAERYFSRGLGAFEVVGRGGITRVP